MVGLGVGRGSAGLGVGRGRVGHSEVLCCQVFLCFQHFHRPDAMGLDH